MRAPPAVRTLDECHTNYTSMLRSAAGPGRARHLVGLFVRHPARVVTTGFVLVVLTGTVLLILPFSSASGSWTAPLPALFTATSAVCVTGLVVVDTGTYWSVFGQGVIAVLFQIGGMGVMTLASLLGIVVARRMGMRMQLIVQAETKELRLADVRRVAVGVVVVSLAIEAIVALIIGVRYYAAYTDSALGAVGFALFHAASAFNNAGFGLRADSMMAFTGDPWILLPIIAAFVLGGIGFPVLLEIGKHLRRERRARNNTGLPLGPPPRWSLHTRITVLAYGALAAVGIAAVLAFEYSNPETLGPLGTGEKILAGVFQGLAPRTVGFNSLDVGQMDSATILITNVLMFIGGGSAGTAGGIKVTTFAILGFVILAELRGQPSVHALDRRIPESVQRQALTIVLLSVAAIISATILLIAISGHGAEEVMFEVISAFATVGLSMGITADLPALGHVVLIALMLIGRIGPVVVASALALQERPRRYELPAERPIVG